VRAWISYGLKRPCTVNDHNLSIKESELVLTLVMRDNNLKTPRSARDVKDINPNSLPRKVLGGKVGQDLSVK